MPERLFSWVTPIQCAAVPHVQKALADIDLDPASNPWLPFRELPMVHFASLTLFPDKAGDRAATLVFENNIDQPDDHYVRELVRVGRAGLDLIYGGCEGYPHSDAPASAVIDFLSGFEKRPQLYHIGHPDRTIAEIRGDHELRRSIEHELSVVDPQLKERAPARIVAAIREKANCPGLLWPLQRPWHSTWSQPPGPVPTPLEEIEWLRDEFDWQPTLRRIVLALTGVLIEVALVIVLEWLFAMPPVITLALASVVVAGLVYMSAQDTRLVRSALSAIGLGLISLAISLAVRGRNPEPPPLWLVIAAGAVLAPAVIIAASYVNIFLRLKVTRPLPVLDQAQRQGIRELLEAEDLERHSIYNHVAGLSTLKKGFTLVRVVRTWLALSFLNLFYRTYFVRGKLASIPSIHFAGWTLIDSSRLLFLTNYEGSADLYLDDFFNKLAGGVAFIWYDTVLFPGTSDPRLLKIWVRQGQTLASVRYRAPVYDALSVALINNNTYIRTRLLRGRGSRSARRWLRRLATTPVEPSRLARITGWLKGLAGLAG
jgi:hypothetical protein